MSRRLLRVLVWLLPERSFLEFVPRGHLSSLLQRWLADVEGVLFLSGTMGDSPFSLTHAPSAPANMPL